MLQESSRHSVVAIEIPGMIDRAAPRRESFRESKDFLRRRTAPALPAFRFEPLLQRGNHHRSQWLSG
jgi:hypothetical protein